MLSIGATIAIPLLAIAVPACLGFYYFWSERERERSTIATALKAEMTRINTLLVDRLTWLQEPGSRDLPLLPFETSLYDAQLGKIGMCSPRFAEYVVSFYGIVHFLNILQNTREAYEAAGSLERFFNTYAKTVRRATARYEAFAKAHITSKS